jgi:mannose-6-phosphate isomerase-like protein (cupin superfamily)
MRNNVLNIVEKDWGWEKWIVNNDFYCGKILHINVGASTSYHKHIQKLETLFVQSGTLKVLYGEEDSPSIYYLSEGESMTIYKNIFHKLIAFNEAVELIEFSTHHEDSDSIRKKFVYNV